MSAARPSAARPSRDKTARSRDSALETVLSGEGACTYDFTTYTRPCRGPFLLVKFNLSTSAVVALAAERFLRFVEA